MSIDDTCCHIPEIYVKTCFEQWWEIMANWGTTFTMQGKQCLNNTKDKRMWGCMWIGVIGEIWEKRNQVILKNGRVDCVEIFTLTQYLVKNAIDLSVKNAYL